MTAAVLPMVIQGGMGVGVSNWTLARAVSMAGQLGVVSGTAVDAVFVRRLQDGDPCGSVRRALARFPIPGVANDIIEKYFRPGGKAPHEPYKALPMFRATMTAVREQITIAANFVEVHLAKEGHDGMVGINLLTKVQMPTLSSLYGAMLAGVDYVLMGAGIPREIPGALDALADGRKATLKLDVEGALPGETHLLEFDPARHIPDGTPLKRPQFLAIISANSLATTLARKANGKVNGFVVEGPTAGGHNAPPRGALQLNEKGEPIYGERDEVDLCKLAELELPFWLAGGFGGPESLTDALDRGAAGVQVGTLFAYSDESGITPEIRQRVLEGVVSGHATVFTDPVASPTGYPFKVVKVDGFAQQEDSRERCCDLGYLRTAYRMEDGRLNYRCSAEPVDTYVKKGGTAEGAAGKRCLCNGLMATIGQPQAREGGVLEPPMVTSGDGLVEMCAFLGGRMRYHATDVLNYLMQGVRSAGEAVRSRAGALTT
jgi:NAD(P)H-dependent flavin oxidoreductase YrpB (nitropropane dioxygenase family)